ncbi:MAG: alpha/beta hydrolase [Myxococcota bacterium]|jgi:pimeloyl-ACP methyl ester carboxylesterase|nr:alpha/beta hydrolase [Myxococcota bacterium]
MADSFDEIELTRGTLRFRALTSGFTSNPDGPVVLCLHGFPDDARSFRFQLPAFDKAGYRVVAPWLRGYEPGSQPDDGDYSLEALGHDVVAWIDELGVDRVHLVGHDWGAAVTYVAGAIAPERFESLATIAVPHAARLTEGIRAVPVQLRKSWYMTFFQLRGVAEWAVERNDWALVKRLWRDWSPDFTLPEAEWSSLRETFEARGVKKAMLAYYRQNASPAVMLGWKTTAAMKRTTVPVPTLAITGEDDGCMDTRLYDHVFHDEDFPRSVEVKRISGAGHFAHQEKPDELNTLLLGWFAGC